MTLKMPAQQAGKLSCSVSRPDVFRIRISKVLRSISQRSAVREWSIQLERFVRITAPDGRLDFVIKLGVLMLICGAFNHIRDMLKYGLGAHGTFLSNFFEAGFTALPMCTFALLLMGHQNALQKRLYRQATQDQLTGLHNRRWFMENTPEQMQAGQTLLILDIDRFKLINDTYGHAVGDRCLAAAAAHLRATIRKSDLCARIGGEEFAVLLNDADRSCIQSIAARISNGFDFDAGDAKTIRVTASVGVSADARTRSQAFKCADDAVYQAKAAGRARYVLADTIAGKAATPLSALAP